MYSVSPRTEKRAMTPARRNVARLLLADSDPASRAALHALLTTAGYAVDCAGTSGEAALKLDRSEYQLVLADLAAESDGAAARLLAYARQKEFCPATALLTSRLSEGEPRNDDWRMPDGPVLMSPENVVFLLVRVAELIGERADRRLRHNLLRVN